MFEDLFDGPCHLSWYVVCHVQLYAGCVPYLLLLLLLLYFLLKGFTVHECFCSLSQLKK